MKRSKFNLSYTKLLSCDGGELIPIGLLEILPGDTVQLATSALLRASPLLSPVMHPVHVRIHHWFVPNRLVWEDWEDFITGGPEGDDTSTPPTITVSGGVAVGSLCDYYGIPPTGGSVTFSAMPLRGYSMIFNEWYRDQDLVTERVFSVADGNDTTTDLTIANIGWEKDYFTSARPWEQKGPALTIPIGTTAPVTGQAYVTGLGWTGNPTWDKVSGSVNTRFGAVTASNSDGDRWSTIVPDGSNMSLLARQNSAGGNLAAMTVNTNGNELVADLSNASAVSVNALREAMGLQRYMENNARYGSRYAEVLRSRFGVTPDDARLQRPEYLGGGKQTIQFSEVLQTAEGSEPVGQMRGHGIAAMRHNRFRKFFTEHGFVHSFLSIKPKTMYPQGQHRHWNRTVKEDYFTPELQHIGQQEIKNKEVYAAGPSPNDTFGFQDRYDEYRRMESTVSGEFRTSQLNFWHMAREFSSAPALNGTFVTATPTERVFAVPSKDVFYCYAKHSIVARRSVAATGRSFIF